MTNQIIGNLLNTDSFKYTANPDEANHFFDEFNKALKETISPNDEKNNFLKIFGNSRFLSQFIINNPDVYQGYQKSPYQKKEKPFEVFQNEVAKLKDDTLVPLKKYKYQEYVRITIKELMGWDQTIVYKELSSLALAIVQKLTKNICGELMDSYKIKKDKLGDFAILAMGKLGGLELNYSSDIDLIGLYDKDQDYQTISSHELFVKLYTKLGQLLGDTDQNGFLFRTDWDLRPEGKSGTLANSITAMEHYYELFGMEWERQAYIKARVLYQKNKLGDQTVAMLTPFVYRKALDEKTIKNIWDMKAKIIQELQKKPLNGINIKLDEGGIRDIEFFIQGFQLLYGGKIEDLRDQNTISTLKKLKKTQTHQARDRKNPGKKLSIFKKTGILHTNGKRTTNPSAQSRSQNKIETGPADGFHITRKRRRKSFR